ncbi:MAG: proline--tRNA ligase, partial [Zetaproteobacteria bacterium CG_4_9_14_3_um_filter_53_7]
EKAVSSRSVPQAEGAILTVVDTPRVTSAEDVAAFLNVDVAQLVKTLVYRVVGGDNDGEIVAACVRGDDQLQEIKLAHAINADGVELASDAELVSIGGITGFVGPMNLKARVVIDNSLSEAAGLVAGANKADAHVTGFDITRDLSDVVFVDLRETRAGDACGKCGGAIELSRGIEVGHVFELGTRYAEPMEVMFQDQLGKRAVATMGCYGIGVSRLMAAVVEQCNDASGIVWPANLAPFQISLITMGKSEEVIEASEKIYKQLQSAGVEVLWDDRKESPGVKFKDAELIGMPVQVVIADRGLKEGIAEFGVRGGDRQSVPVADVAAAAMAQLQLLNRDSV